MSVGNGGDLTPPAFDAPESEWLVYADALQEARDPRGELISLAHAKKDTSALVREHAVAILGEPAATYVDRYRITSWRNCFIDAIDIRFKSYEDRDLDAVSIQSILASPCAAHVREIRLVGVAVGREKIDLTKPMDVLAKCLPSTCTSVAFIDERAANAKMASSRDFTPTSLVSFGSFDPFWKAKNVERVAITLCDVDRLELGELNSSSLNSLVIHPLCYGDSDNEPDVSALLGEAVWPNLEEIEIRLPETYFADIVLEEDAYIAVYQESDNERIQERLDEAAYGENQGTDWGQLGPLLQNLLRTPLKRLALTSCDSIDSLLETIAENSLPPNLKELDLSEASLTKESVKWFVDNKEMLGGLERIVLERTPLTDADLEQLAKIGPKIVWSKGEGALYRYVVGSE